MQYCNKSLIKNNNEILQYFNKNNDIALVMHQHALLDMSDPNAPDKDGWTPIHHAANNGQTDIVKVLVNLTDNPNATSSFVSPPNHMAALNGHSEIVKILDTFECTSVVS